MVPSKARLVRGLEIKQFVSNKPVRFGIKLWELCESATGYCYKFDVYMGKSKEADDLLALGKSAAVVMNLVNGLEHINYDVYIADKGIGACGTIRANRKFIPKAVLVDEVKRQPKGTFVWRTNDSLPSMSWKDHKSVLFLLSIHQPEQIEPAKRKVKRVNIYQETEFPCPKLVNDHNKFMGGVDYNDQRTHLRKEKCIPMNF